MDDSPAPLSFDHATADAPALACGACNRAPEGSYFTAGPKVVCSECAAQIRSLGTDGTPASRLFRALVFGGAGGLVGSVVYGGILLATNKHVGLVSLLSGYLVGLGVSRGSYGRGGLGYQVLAAALTYLSITTACIPLLVQSAPSMRELHGVGFVVAVGFAAVVSLAVPFLQLAEGASGIMGLIILGVGMHQAFRMNRRTDVALDGPYDVPTVAAQTSPVAATFASGESSEAATATSAFAEAFTFTPPASAAAAPDDFGALADAAPSVNEPEPARNDA